MKKTFTLLSLLITMLVEAVAQNDAMFVYCNDGAINGFLKSDIDSIRYSNFDVDSVLHKEYVVQEVWTVDSVYRIPLAAIDSVSFVTPPTVYKEGVIKMGEELVQYVISADSLTLQLKPDTPTSLIPQTDDLLVLLEGCEVLPNGFAGKVKSINTQNNYIEVVCEQTYIEDVFDSFCSVQTLAGYADVNENDPSQSKSSPMLRAIFDPNDRVINLGPYKLSASRELGLNITQNEELALKGGTSFSVSVNPTFRIHTFLIVGAGQGLYFNSSITGNLEVASQLSIYGGLEWQDEFLNPVANIPIPYTGGLINFYLNPGLFIRANAMITTTISDYRNYTFGMAFDYSSNGDNVVKPSLGGRLASHTTDIEGSIDGSIACGAYLEVGFNLVSRELAKVCVRGELGGQLSGSFVLRNSDIENADKESVLYERLKASSLETGPFVNASLISYALVAQGGRTWQMSETENEWDIVPTFEKTKLTHTPGKATSADAYSELSGNCILPVPIGYKLFDEDDNEVADYNASINYTNTPISLKHTFEGISRDNNYTLYPKIRLLGFDILASPSAVLENAHPQITDFQVTNSEYSAGKFTNEGLSYDYKFDVALTVEIDNLDGVEDWGYVYKDPYGNIKRISLMENGSKYTDTRYAYYRNEPHSTACLYTYVKYEGDSEYYDGEPHDYPLNYEALSCPDDHHPHAIDLGLPSGTKWACCNVGASKPEEYGGYYAWGETSEKSSYYYKDYKYYNSSTDEYQDIGEDIAGTSYDVAHVQWGGSWVMPSWEKQKELTNNCSKEWTTFKGVNGYIVTGPNGSKIFLPAAGYKSADGHYQNELYGLGVSGYYYSSTLDPPYPSDHAYNFWFGSTYWYLDDSNWIPRGESVRAVCP